MEVGLFVVVFLRGPWVWGDCVHDDIDAFRRTVPQSSTGEAKSYCVIESVLAGKERVILQHSSCIGHIYSILSCYYSIFHCSVHTTFYTFTD